jgi:phosphatidylcholine synthase
MPYLAHLYTATGALLGFLALVAVAARDFRQAFLWLFAAAVVDASDGWLARRLKVAQRLPDFNGARLDDVVDYVTYVFVPAYLLFGSGALSPSYALLVVGAVLLASLYGFAQEDAKTPDHFFTGFPSYWNIVALYVYVLEWPSWANTLILVTLCGLVFVRTTYVYPSRMPVLKSLTIWAGLVWATLLLWIVWKLPVRSTTTVAISLVFPFYYALLSIYLDRRRLRSRVLLSRTRT